MNLTRVPEYVMNTLCRICARKSSSLISIFKDKLLAVKIDKCLSIKISESDHLPLSVCESCFLKIEKSYTLYETAYESDKRLKKLWKVLVKETLSQCSDVNLPSNNQLKNDIPNIGVDMFPMKDVSDKHYPSEHDISSNTTFFNNQITNKDETKSSNTLVKISQDKHEVLVSPEKLPPKSLKPKDVLQKKSIKNTISDVMKENKILSFNYESKENKIEINKSEETIKIYQCHFCSSQFKTLASLNIHKSTHLQQKLFLCDICGKSFRHSNNLKCHKRVHLAIKKRHSCKICHKEFLTKYFLKEHINSHTGETPYKCIICKKEFREKVLLRQHKWTHSDQKFSCPVCGVKFNRKGNMTKHSKKYHNGSMEPPKKSLDTYKSQNFSCPVCNANFPDQLLFKNHLKLHPEQKKISCMLCGKKFKHSGSLTYHKRTAHTGEKPFKCNYCDQKFSLRSVQHIHERKIHTFEQPYKCSICSRPFTNSSTLKNHLYVHSKTKLFQCEECGKKFSRSSSLSVHKKLHLNDRQFTCDQCGKSYIQKCDLLKHMKIHDYKNKSFFCKYCGNYFSRKKDSSKHATCQFDLLRKNNLDNNAAEEILESVARSFQMSNSKEFFVHEERLILECVKKIPLDEITQDEEKHQN